MPNDFNQVASATSENVKIAGVRIAAERLLHLQRQPVHAFPHLWTPLAPQGFSLIVAADPDLAVAIYPAF
jgi:hypothetical protein